MFGRVFNRGLRCLCAIVVVGTVLVVARGAHGQLPPGVRAVHGDDGELLPDADGKSWDHAYKYLQDALTEARDPLNGITQIWVATTDPNNPYRPDRDSANPTGTGLETARFELVGGVRMMGGFVGGETDADQRDPLNETVISGDLGSGANSYNVLYAPTGLSVLTIVDGFTVRDGVADGDSVTDTWQRQGAGLHIDCADVLILNCRFTNNIAGRDGCDATDVGEGGAVWYTIGPCTGPGFNGQLTIYNTRFDNNEARGAGEGGAIKLNGSDGQGIHLINCLFHHNRAPGVTGGCGGMGGAIFAEGGLDLRNCTFAHNEAMGTDSAATGVGYGGALYTEHDIEGVNCILWYNEDSNDAPFTDWSDQITVTGGTATFTYSDIQSTGAVYPGAGNIASVPDFVSLTSPEDYHLMETSPCRDEGDTSALDPSVFPSAADFFDVDRDGNIDEALPDLDLSYRFFGNAVDMGPYEWLSCVCEADIAGPTGSGYPDGVVDALDFLLLIAEWGDPCTPSAAEDICYADITGATPLTPDGNVDALDFLLLYAQWGDPGNCTACTPAPLMGGGAESESLLGGGLSMDDWAELVEAATDSSETVSANGICWMLHYLTACDGASCAFDGCTGADPLEQH